MANQSSKNIWFLLIGAAAVLILLGYMFLPDQNAKPISGKAPVHVNSDSNYPAAPAFTLKDLNGNDLKLSDYSGKVVFVNFWATWCPPCRAEIPAFIELVDKYGKDGFEVIGIGVDPRDFSKVPGFVEQYNINYPVVYGTGEVVTAYGGIESIPTTFVVNRQGRVVEKIVGSRPKSAFESIITALL
ncbi:MAG: redoxin domain-containing protein [Calditrichaceae bacterium]